MKMVIFTIIVVITSNLIQKITLNSRWAKRTLNFKQVSYESATLHNHCSDNLEPNSKDISEYAVLCSLLRGS